MELNWLLKASTIFFSFSGTKQTLFESEIESFLSPLLKVCNTIARQTLWKALLSSSAPLFARKLFPSYSDEFPSLWKGDKGRKLIPHLTSNSTYSLLLENSEWEKGGVELSLVHLFSDAHLSFVLTVRSYLNMCSGHQLPIVPITREAFTHWLLTLLVSLV